MRAQNANQNKIKLDDEGMRITRTHLKKKGGGGGGGGKTQKDGFLRFCHHRF